MPFAQLVVGPPGAGKSTYCNGMQQFMGAIGRKASVVNLDPANDATSYTPAVDLRNLVTLEEIMKDDNLGPNGGVLYALEELEHNFEWLEEGLKKLGEDYVLFDCPGQVELFTHHDSLRTVFMRLQKMGYRVCHYGYCSCVCGQCMETDWFVIARGSQSYRFIRSHPPESVPFDAATESADDAADGFDAGERAHED